jgi:hypothetical protein
MGSEDIVPARPERHSRIKIVFRLVAGVLLLVVAGVFTWRTIDGLSSRRTLRMDLAEISHARYDLLNVDHWVRQLVPILEARIDALDLKAASKEYLRPMVRNALYRLLANVQEKMSAKPPPSSEKPRGFSVQGNSLIVNMIVAALKPHVPEYSEVVLAELGRPETQGALKKYFKTVLADGAKSTFGSVDMKRYSSILERYGCADAAACEQLLGERIRQADEKIAYYYAAVLISSAVAFLLLLTGSSLLSRPAVVVLLLFCVVLLVGGVLTPMIEVEAKITRMSMTFLGEPVAFGEQVLYFQSKSVLEVFHTLITYGRPDMWIVGVLVLMFSVVFPTLKVLSSALCLYKPDVLHGNRVVRFFALESSKWSMADVMALAIFMAFVAFNGLIGNTMSGLKETGADIAIPTDSSKLLPGCYLFIGFVLASLFLSKKLARGIRTSQAKGSGEGG